MKDILKKLFPYLTGILLFLFLSVAYFNPVIKGDKLAQHDQKTWKGGAKEITDYKEKTGEHSLWTNSLFGGMPSYLVSAYKPNNFFVYLYKFLDFSHPVSITFLYMLGFFIALLIFKVDPWLAMAGAIAYAFSSYFFIIIEAGHLTKALALGFMPPIIAGVYWAYDRNKIGGAVIAGIFLTLQIIVNHLQITYYTFLIILIYGIFIFIKSIKEKTLIDFSKATGFLFAGMLLAILVNFSSIVTIYDYGKDSIRGKSELTDNQHNKTSGLDKDYITAWSYGRTETFTLLIPNLMGGASNGELSENSKIYQDLVNAQVPNAKKIIKQMPLYWGPQPFTSGPVYVGALIFFLFVLGLFLVKGELRWCLLTATLFSIILAWGKNAGFISDFFINYFPGYNKFRTVSMILVIAQFTMPLLGILAIKNIIDKTVTNEQIIKALKWAGGITTGLIVFLMIPGILSYVNANDSQIFPENMIPSLESDRASLFRSDAIRSIFFIAAGVVSIFLFIKNKINKNYFYLILGIAFILDLWIVDKRYLNNDDFVKSREASKVFTPSQCDQYILQDTDPDYRVLNLTVSTFNDASTSYFHKSIGGYHGAKMRRYQDFIDNVLNIELNKIITDLKAQSPVKHIDSTMNLLSGLNMLNTKHIIINPDGFPLINKSALNNAWFVSEVKTVENADEEIQSVIDFDAKNTAIVDKRFEKYLFKFTKDENAKIELTKYAPNNLTYKSKVSTPQLAVFSEIYYEKGWNAYIDGQKVEHFRANYILRAMKIPAGEHKIEFKFEPTVWTMGNQVSLIGSILMILFIAFGIYWEYKNKKKLS